jgi:hypothetical protein
MSKILKYILIGLASVFGLFTIGAIVLNIMIASAFGAFDKNYSVSELKEEYYSNEKKIDELILYFNKIKPKDKIVSIEFRDDEIISRLAIQNNGVGKKFFQSWDFNKEILLTPDIKNMLNWDLGTIEILKEKLDNADCISIEDGEPIKIGFKRSGMGMYSFDVFQNKLTDRNNFNNNCNYILVNNKFALEYGGGAVGPQCFQNFK